MNPTEHPYDTGRPPGCAAVLVLDGDGTVLLCTAAVLELTGLPAEEVRGRRMADLVTDPTPWDALSGLPADTDEGPRRVRKIRTALRHRDGTSAEVDAQVLPLPGGSRERFLVCAVPPSLGQRWTEDQALVRALFTQRRIGLAIHGPDLLMNRLNFGPESVGLPADPKVPVYPRGTRLDEILVPEDAAAIGEQLRRVMETGEPLVDWEHSARLLRASDRERVLSLSAFRLQDVQGRLIGVAAVFTEITEQHLARRRLALLHTASARLGHTLDITLNAEELTRILVPDFADLVSVDLNEMMFHGQEPGFLTVGTPLRRTATTSADGMWPAEVYPVGSTFRIQGVVGETLRREQSVLISDATVAQALLSDDPKLLKPVLPGSAASVMIVPVRARGHVLGAVSLWRGGERAAFTDNDVVLAEEVVSRAALSVENARRYTAELRTVETLQRSLLPPAGLELSAAETTGTYVPASTAAGVGGSWYDVIPLSSTRVAFVVGDVAGHGLSATATMGRLRTAIQTLADLDLTPEELLTHLDDLVIRLADTEPQLSGGESGVIGATCLYSVYDPVTGRCVMASAGHPPPILAVPEQRARFVDLKPGPALGVGGLPIEPVELHLATDSLLAFYTDELVAHTGNGGEDRTGLLRQGMDAAVAAGGSPAEIGRSVLDRVLSEPPTDDVALLVARVRALPEGSTVSWRFTDDPVIVARARDMVNAQLAAWGLEEVAFTTELIVSELVTNAIRYAGSPIGLRLIRDKSLICEVSDPSQTQPHLRRARLTDEGGRGLFLIAQLAHRWGSRYTSSGKTIWTEQPLLNVS
ncbi:MAG TPA: SpoIIE family protein phosphatase [Streptomyces sp.]|nr:SpoIIE family protein phosphatase [Streptomyces sp.]